MRESYEDATAKLLCVVCCIFESGRGGFDAFSQLVYRQDQGCRSPLVHGAFWPECGAGKRRLFRMECYAPAYYCVTGDSGGRSLSGIYICGLS